MEQFRLVQTERDPINFDSQDSLMMSSIILSLFLLTAPLWLAPVCCSLAIQTSPLRQLHTHHPKNCHALVALDFQ